MGTNIRPEISTRNSSYISKHRYYELKHFCLQYDEWKKVKAELEFSIMHGHGFEEMVDNSNLPNPTCDISIKLSEYSERMKCVEEAARLCDREIGNYIFTAVTTGLSFEKLKGRYDIPCGKDMFYDRYRKFFAILSNLRQ